MMPWVRTERVAAFVFVLAIMLVGEVAAGQAPAAASGGYRIAGAAVDAGSGQPLARAEITIESQEGTKVKEAYATGTDGRFSFEGLAPGRYTLLAERRGYVKQAYKAHERYSTAIVVGPGLKTDALRFAMTLGGSITGQVIDERGDVVRNARVILLREASIGKERRLTKAVSKYTNDLGNYRFEHLKAGTYVVCVKSRVWYAESAQSGFVSTEPPPAGDVDTDVAYPVTFYPSAVDAAVAARITLTAGENATANVAIAPVRAQHVTIRVYGDDARHLGMISTELYIAEGVTEHGDFMESVENDGIHIEGLPPSRVDVSWTTGSGKNEEEHLTTLNLAGKVEGNSAAMVVRGVLNVEGGMKAAGMTVKLAYANGGKPFSATVGEKGEFEFREEMVRGAYSVEVPQMAGAAVGVRASGASVTSGDVEIVPGRDVELKVSASAAARVRGRVVENGAAEEGALVALAPEWFEGENNLMRVDQTDSDGTFRLEDVVAGKYTLIAVEDGWDGDWRSAEFLRRFVGGGKKMEVGAGAVVTVEMEVVK
jgi:protocatechuate 3,4-dioxygenase beta subunit